MTLFDLMEDWDDISSDRKLVALQTLFNFLQENVEDHEDILHEIFQIAAQFESDDYFGTEGLKV